MADGGHHDEKQWLSAAELAGLPGMPGTDRGVRKMAARGEWKTRKRARGKGFEYSESSLPAATQAALFLRNHGAPAPEARRNDQGPTDAQLQSAWTRYERSPQHLKDQATLRLRAIQAIEKLVAEGRSLTDARILVAAQMHREHGRGPSTATLARWQKLVERAEKQHRPALLLPAYAGRTGKVEIPVEAWDIFKSDYLRLEAPTATSCYERLMRIAKVRGWSLPSLKTFERRIRAEISPGALIMARQGMEAFDKVYPAQERDRSVFHALEAVNADGHVFDVFARWPDGTVARPIMVGVQDLYSGKLLGYRVGATESSDLARFAFRSVIEEFGIPSKVWLDNGRAFAGKMLTGGAPNRYRFKVKPDDPVGLLTDLGCEIHWTTPYHGQAKPIERAWRDLCDRVAKHPAFAGAYTGNRPDAKPENYGSKAVRLEDFVRVLANEIAAHNAREGRRSRIADGRSFDQVFAASYAQATIRRATAEQLRQMLLATEVVTAHSYSGSVSLAGNRYWSEALAPHAGTKLMLRFDPEQLHAAVEAYTLANVYIGRAECIAAVGFADTEAAREYKRARRQHRRATKAQLDAERRMSAAEIAEQLPEQAPEDLPAAGVVAPIFGRGRPAAPPADPLARTGTDDTPHNESALGDLLKRIAEQRNRDAGFDPDGI